MKTTKDGFSMDEVETYYWETFEDHYEPANGNESLSFHQPSAIDYYVPSWWERTIAEIIDMAREHASNCQSLAQIDVGADRRNS